MPNGEKDFGVPPNLYILATMNTADKSIALVDVALRRRFEFIGLYPDPTRVSDSATSDFLTTLNRNIYAKRKSPDYLIGHAYFMGSQPIEKVVVNKVIPLLLEYFSGKTDIVSTMFSGTGWDAVFNEDTYSWTFERA